MWLSISGTSVLCFWQSRCLINVCQANECKQHSSNLVLETEIELVVANIFFCTPIAYVVSHPVPRGAVCLLSQRKSPSFCQGMLFFKDTSMMLGKEMVELLLVLSLVFIHDVKRPHDLTITCLQSLVGAVSVAWGCCRWTKELMNPVHFYPPQNLTSTHLLTGPASWGLAQPLLPWSAACGHLPLQHQGLSCQMEPLFSPNLLIPYQKMRQKHRGHALVFPFSYQPRVIPTRSWGCHFRNIFS